MKTKTATIVMYTPWGYSGGLKIVDISYRGKKLASFDGHYPSILNLATRWALARGFTATKVLKGVYTNV